MACSLERDEFDRGPTADLWRRTLSQIPSVFGRLSYLFGLRDPNTGRYEHHGLRLVFGEDEANRALKRSHKQIFASWCDLKMKDKKADLDLFLSDFPERRPVLETWLDLKTYESLVPSSIRGPQRRMYIADIKTLILLAWNEAVGKGQPPAA